MKYKSTKDEIFDSIYRAYAGEIYKVCVFLTKDYDSAQDLAQQTFVKFYDRYEKVKPEYTYTYLIRIARNLFYNYQRITDREVSLDELLEEEEKNGMMTDSLEEEYFRKRERALETQLSRKILSNLREENESWYVILQGIYFENKSYEEISEELGITRDVLYSKIYRAKRWVRKRYEKEFDDFIDMS